MLLKMTKKNIYEEIEMLIWSKKPPLLIGLSQMKLKGETKGVAVLNKNTTSSICSLICFYGCLMWSLDPPQ